MGQRRQLVKLLLSNGSGSYDDALLDYSNGAKGRLSSDSSSQLTHLGKSPPQQLDDSESVLR